MFDHVTLRVSNREASELFYDELLAVLGIANPNDHDIELVNHNR
jgi:catechol 2,3-dioxygenase-like lactoylglutathione lyase family enzyme